MEKFLDCFYVIIACYLFQKKHNLFYGLGVKDFLPMSAKYAHANKYFFWTSLRISCRICGHDEIMDSNCQAKKKLYLSCRVKGERTGTIIF